MATSSETPGVLVEHWPTVMLRSAVGYAAALAYFAPDAIQWLLDNMDALPMTDETKGWLRPILVILAVLVARIVKQNGLRRAVQKKELQERTAVRGMMD
jgi:hypothetical protein